MAELLKASGTRHEIQPANGRAFTLNELQKYVGGFIEIVSPAGCINDRLVVNEEGLMMDLAPNTAATCLAGVPIVGDAVPCIERGEELT